MINKLTLNSINGSNYSSLKDKKNQSENIQFKGHGSENNLSKKQKAIILASSGLGMLPVLAFWAKRKGFSLNPSKIIKTPMKDWAIFKYSPKDKAIEFEEPQIISVATGSVVGGYIGGSLVDDKSNLKAKKREVLSQLLGNVLVPVICVGRGSALFEKYSARLQAAMPQINKNTKFTNIIDKCLKNVPSAVATLGFLSIGIYAGNKVSNFINEKLYHKKVERNIKASDFAPHVDDLCMATSMMNKESEFGSKLGRIIPIALLVPGYQTGCAQEKNS